VALWTAGALSARIAKVQASAEVNVVAALSEVAARIEREAKDAIRASGSHPRDTPTPAVKGAAPAIITGTLRRSIIHTRPVPAGLLTWQVKVGMAAGVYPPRGRTPSSKYALYLETVWGYPFLGPAFTTVTHSVSWRALMGKWV